jgi:hypothetical protein
VIWRLLLTALYGGICGALVAYENFHPEVSSTPYLVASLAAPVVGFLVGRWWVVLAVLGVLVGRTIGWDAGENDGVPALSLLHMVAAFFFLALPLMVGFVCSYAWRAWRRPLVERGG